MLFWRLHRCARVLFSLRFHLGEMSPAECVALLVDEVGHERENAVAEVRRSFEGGYDPLYQCAYLIGGFQVRALYQEATGDGGMTPRQFHDTFLRENCLPIAALRASGNPIRLTIAGDGPERAALERRAAEADLAGLVTFRGAVDTVEVPGVLAGADVMLATSVGEGFGLAAAESLMAGVPVVACTDGGGLLDVVPPSGAGRVVAPDPAAIARAIGELAGAESRSSARDEGARWRERLSGDHVASVCAGWYEEALRG